MKLSEAVKLTENQQVIDALQMSATSWSAKYWNAGANAIGGYEEHRSKAITALNVIKDAKQAQDVEAVNETLYGIVKLLGLDRGVINREVLRENLSSAKSASQVAGNAKLVNRLLTGK